MNKKLSTITICGLETKRLALIALFRLTYVVFIKNPIG